LLEHAPHTTACHTCAFPKRLPFLTLPVYLMTKIVHTTSTCHVSFFISDNGHLNMLGGILPAPQGTFLKLTIPHEKWKSRQITQIYLEPCNFCLNVTNSKNHGFHHDRSQIRRKISTGTQACLHARPHLESSGAVREAQERLL